MGAQAEPLGGSGFDAAGLGEGAADVVAVSGDLVREIAAGGGDDSNIDPARLRISAEFLVLFKGLWRARFNINKLFLHRPGTSPESCGQMGAVDF